MRISDWSSDVCSSDLVAVDRDRFAFFDDQRAIEATPNLLETTLVRVVPVGAGVRHVELIEECLARGDWLLGPVRHAVHGIRHAHATPMHGGLLFEQTLDCHSRAPALCLVARAVGQESVSTRITRCA